MKKTQPIYPVYSSRLLFDEAQKLGLNSHWETNYGLFSVELPGRGDKAKSSHFFYSSNFNLNGELSHALVKNKHFTRLILEQAGIVNIPYLLPDSRQELDEFFDRYQPLICKPLLGQRSRGVKLIETRDQLAKCPLKLTFFEKFIEGTEYRYLILENKVIAVQKKELRPTKSQPWKLFYTGLPIKQWNQELVAESLRIASLFELNWAAVDYLVDSHQQAWVLEVNSAPGIVKIHQPDAGVKTNAAELIWHVILKMI
jgi:glutathione synthase/RimK-type ligase-like ATP-grasp enzyme